jgi:hypothetical protein
MISFLKKGFFVIKMLLVAVFFTWIAYFFTHCINFLTLFLLDSVRGGNNIYTFDLYVESPYLQVFNILNFLGVIFLVLVIFKGLEGNFRRLILDSYISDLFMVIRETWGTIIFSILYFFSTTILLIGIIKSQMMSFWIDVGGVSIAVLFIVLSICTYALVLYLKRKLKEWKIDSSQKR